MTKLIPITIHHACLVTRCRNAAGGDGRCHTCRSVLPARRRLKLKRKPGKLRHWVTVRLAVRTIWQRHQQRGRN